MTAISLKQAFEQGSLRISFYCRRPACMHVGAVEIESAIKRSDGKRLLDEIKARCKAVNSRDNNFTANKVEKRIEQGEVHIARYLTALERADTKAQLAAQKLRRVIM